MACRTIPLDRLHPYGDLPLVSLGGGASRAVGQCLAALALVGMLAACGESQTVNDGSESVSLEERMADGIVHKADCNGTGTVANLESNDDFVTVFTGPSITSPPKVRAKAGVLMHLCTPSPDGRYIGIIYQHDGELPDLERCNFTTAPVPRYEAPCGSGWVYTSEIEAGRILTHYVERKETKAIDTEAAMTPRDNIAAIDRLNDRLNGRFPISKYQGYVMNYRSLGTGCQGFVRNEIHQQGDTLDHRAEFDYSEIASVGDIYHNTSAQPGIFQFSIQIAPDESGVSRVKISASREGYDTSPRDGIELGLLTREAADEVRGTLLQLRSLCRALKRKEQASADTGGYQASGEPDFQLGAGRNQLLQGKADASDLG